MTDTVVSPLRSCGSCMLCCKLPSIPEMNKPVDVWCKNARPGRGCGIYAERPEVCRAFACEWLTDSSLPENWKPERSKFFVNRSGHWYLIHVDPAAPMAWKQSQYYSGIKMAAARFAETGIFVMVRCGAKKIVVLPDRDEDVPQSADVSQIYVEPFTGPAGVEYVVRMRAG